MSEQQLTEQQLRHMATDNCWGVRADAAANLACPKDLLLRLATDNEWWVRAEVAKNPACPEKLFQQLAADKNEWVRTSVAKNPACPQYLLGQLAIDEQWDVRISAAKNPACPEYLLRQLAAGKDKWVRAEVAKNPASTEHLLRQLSIDENELICANLAQNPSTPIDVVLFCLPCWGTGDGRSEEVQTAFDVHKEKLLSFARSCTLNFDLVCAGGETLKDGLIHGGQVEIYNLLIAEHLTGKAELLANDTSSLHNLPSRHI